MFGSFIDVSLMYRSLQADRAAHGLPSLPRTMPRGVLFGGPKRPAPGDVVDVLARSLSRVSSAIIHSPKVCNINECGGEERRETKQWSWKLCNAPGFAAKGSLREEKDVIVFFHQLSNSIT